MTIITRLALAVLFVVSASRATADVVNVTIASRSVVAGGAAFGAAGAYERLSGTIEFALDPRAPENARIVDLDRAARAADGRVHFMSDLHVLRPVEEARRNGVMFFEASNRGRFGLLSRFAGARQAIDGSSAADFGDGFLLRDGFTLVWVGWEFDVQAPLVRADAPLLMDGQTPLVAPAAVWEIPDKAGNELTFEDAPMYHVVPDRPAELTVRTRFWDAPRVIPRERWRFAPDSAAPPKLHLNDPVEPGKVYELTYHAKGARAAGVGFAALRDAASAFRYRNDMPVRGKSAYVFGSSQTGRFLREFLYQGFNADGRGRRVFDAVWTHVSGAARGRFNERFVTPTGLDSFIPTNFPYADAEHTDPATGRRDGLLAVYGPDQRPKVFHTNTSVEYWGQGRAAALMHTTPDGRADAPVAENVRLYLIAGAQHGEAPFPPQHTNGQQRNNPIPQRAVLRALFQALHEWTSNNVAPPASRHPTLADATLTSVEQLRWPKLPGVREPRGMTGPGRLTGVRHQKLPYLVPQVDADGNEMAGIRVPEQIVPLATTTGWNFRSAAVGNADELYSLLGSYIPFARTRGEREAAGDPRLSIEERYKNKDDYMQKVSAAAADLVRNRLLLQEDVASVVKRATAHWDHATRPSLSSAK